MAIHILLTGGTIDKHYIETDGSMDFVDSHIPDILKQGRNRQKITIDQVVFKDSLEMTIQDRELIATSCLNSSEKKIIITHGTDTMIETAKHIASSQAQLMTEKCIVLVGAMIPHEISYSDSTFNLGFALGAVSGMQNGLYIAMNGQIFDWGNVQKNHSIGEFQTL